MRSLEHPPGIFDFASPWWVDTTLVVRTPLYSASPFLCGFPADGPPFTCTRRGLPRVRVSFLDGVEPVVVRHWRSARSIVYSLGVVGRKFHFARHELSEKPDVDARLHVTRTRDHYRVGDVSVLPGSTVLDIPKGPLPNPPFAGVYAVFAAHMSQSDRARLHGLLELGVAELRSSVVVIDAAARDVRLLRPPCDMQVRAAGIRPDGLVGWMATDEYVHFFDL